MSFFLVMEATSQKVSIKLPGGLKQGCMSHAETNIALNFKDRMILHFCKVLAISVTREQMRQCVCFRDEQKRRSVPGNFVDQVAPGCQALTI